MTLSPERPVSVAVLNDHELIVRGVAAMLAPYPDLVEVVELDAGVPLKRAVDVTLYDTYTRTSFKGSDLDDLALNPLVGRLVLYTWVLTEELAASARARGVHAALPKSLDGLALASALVKVHGGLMDLVTMGEEPVISSQSWPGRDQGLTPRESEIIALVTSGLSNNEIAERTYLSINSVKSYIRSAYRTMGVLSRSQAVLWGVDNAMAPTRMRVTLPPADVAAGAPATQSATRLLAEPSG
ncbi:MAG: response regulator transcription factor [Knoellia sp.]